MCPGSILYYIMWELFKTFFHIGLFTFGGGYAMIPLIETKVVDEKKWIDREMLLDLIAIAQSCPGIFAVNISIFIGYRIKGTAGAVVGALATSLPSFIIILAIALFFQQFRENEYVDRFFRGLRPAVVALIAAPVFRMAEGQTAAFLERLTDMTAATVEAMEIGQEYRAFPITKEDAT